MGIFDNIIKPDKRDNITLTPGSINTDDSLQDIKTQEQSERQERLTKMLEKELRYADSTEQTSDLKFDDFDELI